MSNINILKLTEMLNEFNSKDKNMIQAIGDYFTISIEYEIICDIDIIDEPFLETDEEIVRALNYVKNQTMLELSRGMVGERDKGKYKISELKLKQNEQRMFKENNIKGLNKKEIKKLHHDYYTWTWVNYFINKLLDNVDIDNEEKTNKRLNKIYDNKIDDYIVTLVIKNLGYYVYGQNMDWLIDNFQTSFPKFYNKWSTKMKFEFEPDSGDNRILEISPKTYLEGIDQCFEQIDDFYAEFENQNIWKMDNNRTGIHINIGVSDNKIKWNPLKGMLMMSDINRHEKTPYVFKDIAWRMDRMYTKSLLDAINRNLTGEIKSDWDTKDKDILFNLNFRHKKKLSGHKKYLTDNIEKIDIHNIRQTEDFLNSFLIKANKDFYIKEFGIKLVELEDVPGYVEFRYVGGKVGMELLKDKVMYFCYIVYLMTNQEYKKRDYQKKLYKYIQQLKGLLQEKYSSLNE